MKTEELFLIVRTEVQTKYENIHEALEEMEKTCRFLMTDTTNVKVKDSEILTTKSRNPKNSDHWS